MPKDDKMAWVEVLFHGCFRTLFIPITLLRTNLGGSMIAAAKADIEQHTTAPVAVSRPSQGWTPGRCLGGCGVPGAKD